MTPEAESLIRDLRAQQTAAQQSLDEVQGNLDDLDSAIDAIERYIESAEGKA